MTWGQLANTLTRNNSALMVTEVGYQMLKEEAEFAKSYNRMESAAPMVYFHLMIRSDAIARLREQAQTVRGMGATALYLFGSTVRDKAHAGSDLDLFIDYDQDSRFNAFDLIGIKLLLETKLAVPIDITTRDGLHAMLKSDIEQSAIRVF